MQEMTWEKKGVVITYTGAITSGEMNLAAARVQGSAMFDMIRYVIHDFTACDSLTYDLMELTTMVARASVAVERHTTFAVAFVGTGQTLREAFRHFKSVGIYDREFELYASLTEARAFIAHVTGIDAQVNRG
jgi:hypothetical protein